MKEETDYCSWRRNLVACEEVLHSLTKGDCTFVLFFIYYYYGYCLQEKKEEKKKGRKQKAERNDLRHEAFSQCYHCLFLFSAPLLSRGEKEERQRSFVLLSFTTTVLSIALCLHVVITGCVTAWNTRLSPLVLSQARNNTGLQYSSTGFFGTIGTCWLWMNVV